MKPKLKEFIPIYGMFAYMRRYFDTLQRPTNKEIKMAMWMEMYHTCSVGPLCLFIAVHWLLKIFGINL